MGAFPRAMQSETGMRATRWHAMKHGVSQIPTVRVTKSCREAVKAVGGVLSETYQGQEGHLYTMNGLHDILRRVSLLHGCQGDIQLRLILGMGQSTCSRAYPYLPGGLW